MGLALRRKAGEIIQIGDDVTIRIGETHTGYVVLDIDAPGHVTIRRGEVPPLDQAAGDAGDQAPAPSETEPMKTA